MLRNTRKKFYAEVPTFPQEHQTFYNEKVLLRQKNCIMEPIVLGFAILYITNVFQLNITNTCTCIKEFFIFW